jgi:hypothetical protein
MAQQRATAWADVYLASFVGLVRVYRVRRFGCVCFHNNRTQDSRLGNTQRLVGFVLVHPVRGFIGGIICAGWWQSACWNGIGKRWASPNGCKDDELRKERRFMRLRNECLLASRREGQVCGTNTRWQWGPEIKRM